MDLTPEEKKKIYEEEKARIEVQEKSKTEKKEDDSKMRKLSVSVVISYIFVGFFVLLAIGASQSSELTGLIFFITAIFLVPPINNILFQKLMPFVKKNSNSRLIQTAINVFVAFVLFVVGISFLPSTGETASNKTTTPVPTTSVKSPSTKKKTYVVKPREIESLHQAYIGHWKFQGADGSWVDYYVTGTTSKWGIMEGEYTVSSEDLATRELMINETLTMPRLQPITGQTSIKFSKDYRSAILTYNWQGPEKHRLKYVGK